MRELEGVNISCYHLYDDLGQGGMSEIYLARDRRTGQKVVLKLVHSSNAEYFERFRREITVMISLKHEHILPILDYGEYDAWLYMVAPYFEYGSLDTRLASGPMTPQEAGEILEQLTNALQFSHTHGIIHRDIKPSNVFLLDGHFVYLADFGLAKSAKDELNLTQMGYVMGTPEYVAPELATNVATIACDVYALGVLLYQMLTGSIPFEGDNALEIFWKQVYEQPIQPSRLNPSLTPAIEQVMLHALEKEPQDRFQSVLDLAQAYQQALALSNGNEAESMTNTAIVTRGSAVFAHVINWLLRRRKRTPLIMTTSLAVVLLIGALLFGLSLYGVFGHPTMPTRQTTGDTIGVQSGSPSSSPTPISNIPPSQSTPVNGVSSGNSPINSGASQLTSASGTQPANSATPTTPNTVIPTAQSTAPQPGDGGDNSDGNGGIPGNGRGHGRGGGE